MKMSKKIRTLVSTALISAMVLTMGGMSAFAAVSEVTLTKEVTTDGDTFAPNTSFNFSVTTGEKTSLTIDDKQVVVYAGVSDGLYFEEGKDTVKFEPATPAQASYTKTSELKVDSTKFTTPGIYHYVITEIKGSYEGIVYDTTKRDVYVTVTRDEKTNAMVVESVVCWKEGAEAKSELKFVNDYGKKEDNDSTHDITIEKQVTGNQGDRTKSFDFAVSVDGADGEWYKVVKTDQNGDTTESHLVSKADAVTYSLKHGESIQIFGLTSGDSYTVNEDKRYITEDSYTVTNGEITGYVTADETKITVTNNKEVTTPTGIVMTFGPYVLLIALAGVFATLFFRRKREEF